MSPVLDPIQDERRHARDSYRAAGGSRRRPLHSFRTKQERIDARTEHAAMLRGLYTRIGDDRDLAAAWIDSMERNQHLTPINALIAAAFAPGLVVGTVRQWNRLEMRVAKGATARFNLTGPGFVPAAAFTERDVVGDLPPIYDPALDEAEPFCGDLRAAVCDPFREAVASGRKPSDALRGVAEAICGDGATCN